MPPPENVTVAPVALMERSKGCAQGWCCGNLLEKPSQNDARTKYIFVFATKDGLLG